LSPLRASADAVVRASQFPSLPPLLALDDADADALALARALATDFSGAVVMLFSSARGPSPCGTTTAAKTSPARAIAATVVANASIRNGMLSSSYDWVWNKRQVDSCVPEGAAGQCCPTAPPSNAPRQRPWRVQSR